MDDDDDFNSDNYNSQSRGGRRSGGRQHTPSQSSRRTTFMLGGQPEADVGGDSDDQQADMQRLLKSVEKVARRVVQDSHGSKGGVSPILGVKGDSYFDQPSPILGNESGMVNIRRPVYSQSNFAKIWEEHEPNDDPPTLMRFIDNIHLPENPQKRCTDSVKGMFPNCVMISNYNIRKNLLLDIVSGVTTGVMRIPQSMAYSLLARLPPAFGLYTAFFSAIFYTVFGGSHHMAAGAQGVISLMVGAGIDMPIDVDSENFTSGSINGTMPPEIDQEAVRMTIAITMMVGVIQMLMGLLRLGFVTNYLSDPLIGGFTTGAACHVVVSQMSTILGVKTDSYSGNFNLWYLMLDIIKHLDHVNVASLLISVFCVVFLSTVKYLNSRYKHKLKIPIPGELMVLGITIAFSFMLDIHHRWKVKVVGTVPTGFITPQLPDPSHISKAWNVAFPSAIVSFAIGYSISKRLALRNDYEIDGNQEVFAFGFMNMAGSFFGCFTSTASMSASSLHESLGGKTQVANIVASILVLFTILFLGPLFKPAPDCVLSCILLVNLKSILSQFGDLKTLWSVSKIDFLLWVVTWLAVIILDVDVGLGMGVAFSLLTIVFRTQWPYSCVLGRIPSTDIYKNRAINPDADEVPGIKIFRFEGSLYFASSEHFRNILYKETNCNPIMIAHKRQELEQKLLIVKEQVRNTLIHNGSALFDHNITSEHIPLLDNKHMANEPQEIHHVILDFSSCSFIDSVGVRTLSQVLADYKEIKVKVFLANVRAAVRSMLFNTEAFSGKLTAKNIFLSVHDAVVMALEEAQKMDERDFLIMDAGMKSVTRYCSRVHSRVHSDVE